MERARAIGEVALKPTIDDAERAYREDAARKLEARVRRDLQAFDEKARRREREVRRFNDVPF